MVHGNGGAGEAPILVALRGVMKSYREGEAERVVFRDLSAEIRQGEFVAVLGRSGSGKSTLLNLISGIDLPGAGEITVEGLRLDRAPERDRTLFRRRRVGLVFQFLNLIPTLTVEENLTLPLALRGDPAPERRRKALEMLDRVGLADRRGSFPDRLSGGEQQRVAVARALVHEPALLLADEPTGTLDAETGSVVLRLLTRLGRERAMTMVVATHSPEVARIADRIATVREGRLADEAPPRGFPG